MPRACDYYLNIILQVKIDIQKHEYCKPQFLFHIPYLSISILEPALQFNNALRIDI